MPSCHLEEIAILDRDAIVDSALQNLNDVRSKPYGVYVIYKNGKINNAINSPET